MAVIIWPSVKAVLWCWAWANVGKKFLEAGKQEADATPTVMRPSLAFGICAALPRTLEGCVFRRTTFAMRALAVANSALMAVDEALGPCRLAATAFAQLYFPVHE
jgi:hypothetical protein